MNIRHCVRLRAARVARVSTALERSALERTAPAYRSASASLSNAIGALCLAVGQADADPQLARKHLKNARSRIAEAVRMLRNTPRL